MLQERVLRSVAGIILKGGKGEAGGDNHVLFCFDGMMLMTLRIYSDRLRSLYFFLLL